MKTIYKYEVEMVGQVFSINLPLESKILDVQVQGGTPYLWVLHEDVTQPKSKRHFRIVGTGHGIDPLKKITHIGTFQQPPFVWHLFEVT